MRILCRHGHFAFYPRGVSDIARFVNRYGVSLQRVQDFYTFESIAEAPDYSITGKTYVNLPATETYEGNPWDVMRENGFVYDLSTSLLVPVDAISILINPARTGLYFTSQTPLIQPGSRNIAGDTIMTYDAEFDFSAFMLRVREFQYV